MTSSMVTSSKQHLDRTYLGVMIGSGAPAVDTRIAPTFPVKQLQKSSDECGTFVDSDGCSSEFHLCHNDFESGQQLIALDK